MEEVKTRNGFVFETQHQRKDGTTFPVEVSSGVIDIKGKKFYQYIIRDITERKRAEKELRAVLLYTRNLIESSLDALVTINSDGKITDVNKTTEEITGIPRARLIGADFSQLLYGT